MKFLKTQHEFINGNTIKGYNSNFKQQRSAGTNKYYKGPKGRKKQINAQVSDTQIRVLR